GSSTTRSGRARWRAPPSTPARPARGRPCATSGCAPTAAPPRSPRAGARAPPRRSPSAASIPRAPRRRPSAVRTRSPFRRSPSGGRIRDTPNGGRSVRSRLSRLARMDRAELAWRAAAAARITADRLRTRIVAPTWDRGDLRGRLAPLPELSAVRDALADRRWDDAQHGLAAHFTTAPQRFVVGPRARAAIVDRIRAAFPQSVAHAAARADRIVAGEYDLLGYRGLRYSPPASASSRVQPPAKRRTASDAPDPSSGLPDLDWHWD